MNMLCTLLNMGLHDKPEIKTRDKKQLAGNKFCSAALDKALFEGRKQSRTRSGWKN
jgi:hypothetical protein